MLICIWCINSKPPHDIHPNWKKVPCTVMFLGGRGGDVHNLKRMPFSSRSILLEGNLIAKHLIFDSLEWRMWRQMERNCFIFIDLNVQECMVHNQTIFNQININYFLFQLAPFDIPIFITNSTGHSSVTFMAHEWWATSGQIMVTGFLKFM